MFTLGLVARRSRAGLALVFAPRNQGGARRERGDGDGGRERLVARLVNFRFGGRLGRRCGLALEQRRACEPHRQHGGDEHEQQPERRADADAGECGRLYGKLLVDGSLRCAALSK